MMRLLYLFFISCFLYVPLNSQEQESKINYTDKDGLRQGHWKVDYPNGNIRYTGNFKDNRPVGELIRYFPNGNKMAAMFFCDEGRRAEVRLFYENGNFAAEGFYFDEIRDSTWKYYSYYGSHLSTTVNYKYGVKEGLSAVYYPNGQMAESFWYENDSRNGTWRQYYENGDIRVEAKFKDDQRHGDFVFFAPGGRTEIKGSYSGNLMQGEWIYYNESGQEVSVINYIEGRPENEDELIEKEQEMFRQIEQMQGRIPDPDESELFFPRGH